MASEKSGNDRIRELQSKTVYEVHLLTVIIIVKSFNYVRSHLYLSISTLL